MEIDKWEINKIIVHNQSNEFLDKKSFFMISLLDLAKCFKTEFCLCCLIFINFNHASRKFQYIIFSEKSVMSFKFGVLNSIIGN